MLAAPAILSQGGCSAECFSAGPPAGCNVAVCARCRRALPDCMVVDFRPSRKQLPHLSGIVGGRLGGIALCWHRMAAMAAINNYPIHIACLGDVLPARFCRQHMGCIYHCHADCVSHISRICMRGAHLHYRIRKQVYAS